MISFFSKYRRVVFIVTVAIFLVGVFVGLGAYVFTSGSLGAVADVGGKKISYDRFMFQVNRILYNFKDSGTDVTDIVTQSVKQEVFREMVIEELLAQEAARLGMRVPDFEVAMEIQNTPQFREGTVFDMRKYYQTVYREFQMSPSEYEAWRKKSRLSSKLKQFITTSIKITPLELKAYYLAKNKDMKNFEKDKDKYLDELTREKFAQTANYLLRQLTTRIQVKDYRARLEKVENAAN